MILNKLDIRNIVVTLFLGCQVFASTSTENALDPAPATTPAPAASPAVTAPAEKFLEKPKASSKPEDKSDPKAAETPAKGKGKKAKPSDAEIEVKKAERTVAKAKAAIGSPLATDKEKAEASHNLRVAEAALAVAKANKALVEAKEEDKKAAQEKLTAAEKVLAETKAPVSPETKPETTPEAEVGKPAEAKDSPHKEPEGKLQEEAKVAQAEVEKIIGDARKNPALKKKLEEAMTQLKAAGKDQKDAKATFDEANKKYQQLKNNSKADKDELKSAEEAYTASLEIRKKADAALIVQKAAYETLLRQTETTKQLRIREYKAALALRVIVDKQLQDAEKALKALDAQMDKLLEGSKGKKVDKDNEQQVGALEKQIESAQKHLDTIEEHWDEVRTKLAIARLRAETVLDVRTRERDRAKERLESLKMRAQGKRPRKSKKGKNLPDIAEEIQRAQQTLNEKEKILKATQKRKDAQELDVTAIAFDPNDPQDADLLEEEITTPEERAAAKKALSQVIKDYWNARKSRMQAEQALLEAEKTYMDLKWKSINIETDDAKKHPKSKQKKGKDKKVSDSKGKEKK